MKKTVRKSPRPYARLPKLRKGTNVTHKVVKDYINEFDKLNNLSDGVFYSLDNGMFCTQKNY